MSDKSISKDKYEESEAWGLLTSIDLFGCDPEAIRDENKIKNYIFKLCELIDMKRFGEIVIVRFGADPKVQGYSVVQLIETSCVSGHFSEESNSAYIDIFSCKFYEQKEAVEFTKQFFKAKGASYNVLLRK